MIGVAVSIGAQTLKHYAIGDTIADRFANVIKPRHLNEGCWMTTNDDEMFRSAVGAVMLSYGPGTPEFEQIEQELLSLRKFNALLGALQAGVPVDIQKMANEETAKPSIGLMKLWHAREKS